MRRSFRRESETSVSAGFPVCFKLLQNHRIQLKAVVGSFFPGFHQVQDPNNWNVLWEHKQGYISMAT